MCIRDSANATASLNLDISVIANVAPVITEMTIASVKERAHLNFSPEVTDIEEQEVSYQWIQTAGTPVVINEPAVSTLSFDAPSISEDETITFSLTVTDTYNDSTTAEVDIALSAFEEIQISDITDNGLAKCLVNDSAADMGLTKITCDEVKIESLGDLNSFPLLTEVSITNADIIDISALTDVPQLTKLNLSHNNITDTSTLTELVALIELNLSSNLIQDSSALVTLLAQLPQLSILNLDRLHKQYSVNINVENLTDLTDLTSLTLNNNNVSNTSELSQLKSLSLIHI